MNMNVILVHGGWGVGGAMKGKPTTNNHLNSPSLPSCCRLCLLCKYLWRHCKNVYSIWGHGLWLMVIVGKFGTWAVMEGRITFKWGGRRACSICSSKPEGRRVWSTFRVLSWLEMRLLNDFRQMPWVFVIWNAANSTCHFFRQILSISNDKIYSLFVIFISKWFKFAKNFLRLLVGSQMPRLFGKCESLKDASQLIGQIKTQISVIWFKRA